MSGTDLLKALQKQITMRLRSHAIALNPGYNGKENLIKPGVLSIALSEKNRWYLALSAGALRNFRMDYMILRNQLSDVLSPVINAEICLPQERPAIQGPKEKRFQHKLWRGAEHNPACAEKHLTFEALTNRKEELKFLSNSAFPYIENPADILNSYRGKPHSDGFVPICPCESCSAILEKSNIKFVRNEFDIDEFDLNDSGIWVPKKPSQM